MKISDVRATTVSVPLEAPLRHANGCHWGRFVRTIVEVEADNGLVGLGELGGGGESAAAGIRAMKTYLVGRDPARLEEMRFLLSNPTASLYNNRSQMAAALEFACLDLVGQAWGVPVSEILGGRVRDRVTFASYLFFRYAARNGTGTIRTIDQVLAYARALKSAHGFTSHKMKGGVFPPDYELECYRALAAEFPGDRCRFDPNAVWSTDQAVRFGRAIEHLEQRLPRRSRLRTRRMRSVREKVSMPLATNTVVVNFEQLATNVLRRSVDVILLDTTFWGGIRPCVKAAGVCETFQLGVAVHSSGELGIQLATMLHLGAVVPNLSFAADAHYHHLEDDVIEGGKLTYENGRDSRARCPRAGRAAGPRQARQVRGSLSPAWILSVRSGPWQAGLDTARPERSLGRPWRPSRALRRVSLNAVPRASAELS
jgi:glucarate dehydratase